MSLICIKKERWFVWESNTHCDELFILQLHMQKLTYKCFIRKVIDNPKRGVLYRIVPVHFWPDLVGWGLHPSYWRGSKSLFFSSSSLQRNQAFVFLSSNSFRSSRKYIEKLLLFHQTGKSKWLDFILMFHVLLQDKCVKNKSIKIGCLPSLLFRECLPDINRKKGL